MILFTVLRSLLLAILQYARVVAAVCYCVVNDVPLHVREYLVVGVGLTVSPLLSFRDSA